MLKQEPLNATLVRAGDGLQNAEPLGEGIYMSRDVSNCYRVITAEGDVMINTGFPPNGSENHRRLSVVSENPISKIIFTQSHPDHIGGWRWFVQDETETIAQANFDHVYGYFEALRPAMTRRSRHLWKRDIKETLQEFVKPKIDTFFSDYHRFELGGREFQMFSTPGGETLDSVVVWLPKERVVFTGNLTGPLFGHVPNLYTLRGDKIRYVQWYIDGVQRVIDLQPEMLITGHGEPIKGRDKIHQELNRIVAAVTYVKNETLDGMNQGKSLWQLMRDIRLPDALAIGQGHGKVMWMVRAIWEEHFGWFRFESTTELYPVPAREVYADVARMLGPEKLLQKAQAYLKQQLPMHAIHLLEMAAAGNPNTATILIELQKAHRMQLALSGRENFSEVRWLESEISRIDEKLKEDEANA